MPCYVLQTIDKVGIAKRRVENIVNKVLQSLHHKEAEISVHFVGDKRMRTLNRTYRNKDKTTDVLAFAMQEGDAFDNKDWGDIFISIPQIKKQAKENKIKFEEELVRMLVHGILHLAGYDHIKKRDAKVMLPLQEKLLAKFVKDVKGSNIFL